MTARTSIALLCALGLATVAPAPPTLAQLDDLLPTRGEHAAVSPEEITALALLEAGQLITARERAEAILKENPNSFMGHLVLGRVLREAEASYPRALFHLQRALELYEGIYGKSPPKDLPWQFHAIILQQLADTEGDLEHHEKRLELIDRFNRLYDPDMIAEQAWPLMKLGRYEEAKAAAEEGLHIADRPLQRLIALNALCAIEFEAGQDGASYDACKRAVDDARGQGRRVSAVDLTNLSEAARSLFRLEEAERYAIEATEAPVSYYGNPWLDLAEIYTRQGRFPEALSALKEIPEYRAGRPPETRMSDMNETRRALSALLITLSKAEEAVALTSEALVRPDRRGHHSRDDVQDGLVSALLDRAARKLLAARTEEEAAASPFLSRQLLKLKAVQHGLSAWHSGRLAARLLDTDEKLVGIFRVGTSSSAVMPAWLPGELVSVLGAGVVLASVDAAEQVDMRDDAPAYYAAYRAEALLAMGEDRSAWGAAGVALGGLPKAEMLLRARTHVIAGQALMNMGGFERAQPHFEAAFEMDPGIFRRMDVRVPVRIAYNGVDAEQVADALARSPRLDDGDEGFALRVSGAGAGLKACLFGAGDAVLACGSGAMDNKTGMEGLVWSTVQAFHDEAFAPRVTLTTSDINSLDGSNLVGREALEEALGQ